MENIPDEMKEMRNRYVEAVKAHTITPIAALLGKYLLFCETQQEETINLCFVMKLLLQETPETALKLHNWKTVQ